MTDGVKTGLTTVTFRKLDMRQIVSLALRAGLDGLEIGGDVHLPPGNIAEAEKIRSLVEENGLEVFSYGSYFTAGESDDNAFEEILQTAAALGAKCVRVWTKQRGGNVRSGFDKTASSLKNICAAATPFGIEIGMEFHNGTYNDNSFHSLEILEAVGADNLFTYWQPLYGARENLADIAALKNVCKHVHVYNWIYGGNGVTRLALDEPPERWRDYVCALGGKTYIMEFVKDDNICRFLSDAEYLQSIIKEKVR